MGSYQHVLVLFKCNPIHAISFRLFPFQVLSVIILQMNIEHHYSCAWDALSLYDDEAHLIASLCGTSSPPTFYTSGVELLITLTTEGSVASTGFKLEVTVTNAPADGATFAPFVPVDGSPTVQRMVLLQPQQLPGKI